MMRSGSLLCCLTLLHFLGNCNGAFAGEPDPAKAHNLENPFAYCSRVVTADSPAGGSSPVPPALTPFLARALGFQANVEFTAESYYWRCMDGAVYVCAIGANLPCDTKADLAKRNLGAENYCRENSRATAVPAYATGHRTIYGWRCSTGRAVRGKQLIKVDARRFQSDFWFRVSPIS
jgi:hypothetical protein